MFRFLMIALALATSFNLSAQSTESSSITWMTNYDEASALSKSTGKPMVILFTGSDWCVWCIKAEKEIFSTPEFAQIAGNQFIFVKADFPFNQDLPLALVTQNEKLKSQFAVKGFPTVVIVTPSGKALGTVGYSEGGGAKYANMLIKLSQENSAQAAS